MAQLRVRTAPRAQRFPLDTADALPLAEQCECDDALGLAAWRVLAEALGRGVPPPAALLFRSDTVLLIELTPLLQAKAPLDGRDVAGLASIGGISAMAVIGALVRRERGKVLGRFGVVYLEWPDGRWWLARRPMTETGLDPLAEVTVERAMDGQSKPGGIGGWFRRVRVEGIRAAMDPIGSDN